MDEFGEHLSTNTRKRFRKPSERITKKELSNYKNTMDTTLDVEIENYRLEKAKKDKELKLKIKLKKVQETKEKKVANEIVSGVDESLLRIRTIPMKVFFVLTQIIGLTQKKDSLIFFVLTQIIGTT